MTDDDLYADDDVVVPLDEDEKDSGPISEPDDSDDRLPLDHPQTDTNIDAHELYDEGLDGAADVDVP